MPCSLPFITHESILGFSYESSFFIQIRPKNTLLAILLLKDFAKYNKRINMTVKFLLITFKQSCVIMYCLFSECLNNFQDILQKKNCLLFFKRAFFYFDFKMCHHASGSFLGFITVESFHLFNWFISLLIWLMKVFKGGG